MAKVLKFTPDPPSRRKSGFRKVHKKLDKKLEENGQLNLFKRDNTGGPKAKQIRLSPLKSAFELALDLDERNDPKAVEAYQDLIDKSIDEEDAYCNLGIIQASRGETIKAIDSFTLALRHNARHVESHYNLGNMYFDASNYQLAITHYEIAKEIDPEFPELLFNLSLAYAIQKQFNKALEIIKVYQKTSVSSQSEVEIILQYLSNR